MANDVRSSKLYSVRWRSGTSKQSCIGNQERKKNITFVILFCDGSYELTTSDELMKISYCCAYTTLWSVYSMLIGILFKFETHVLLQFE